MVGHIKIDRKILNWEWYTDLKVFHFFLYLLLKANHKDGNWKGTLIKRGEVIIGREKSSKDTGLTENEIRTCIKKLKLTNEITTKTTNKYTIVTICKYNFYQSNNYTSNQQNDQQVDQQLTNKSPTINQQLTTNNNDNNNKEDNPMRILGFEGNGIVLEMSRIFKKWNPNIQIEPEAHYPHCLQLAYRIATLKGWNKKDVLNGKMNETLKSWETIVEFIKTDSWLSTRSLIDLNTNKEWDRLIMKMTNSKISAKKEEDSKVTYIKSEKEVDFDKYKRK